MSGPRNISTALMYSFNQREDTIAVDEPFYGYYLAHHEVDHPGKEKIMQSMETDWNAVLTNLLAPKESPIFFIKNMAHHLTGDFQALLQRAVNVFLIRDPRQLIASFAKVIENPSIDDIGLRKEWEIFIGLSSENSKPIVINSGVLLKDPEKGLHLLCNRLGISFDHRMLEWPAGPKSIDGCWAPYWYSGVHKSTGFKKKPATEDKPLPEHLQNLYEEALPYFEELNRFALNFG